MSRISTIDKLTGEITVSNVSKYGFYHTYKALSTIYERIKSEEIHKVNNGIKPLGLSCDDQAWIYFDWENRSIFAWCRGHSAGVHFVDLSTKQVRCLIRNKKSCWFAYNDYVENKTCQQYSHN